MHVGDAHPLGKGLDSSDTPPLLSRVVEEDTKIVNKDLTLSGLD